MSKKKKGKKKVDSQKINRVIQDNVKSSSETVMAHLKRVGINPIIDKMSMDWDDPEVYVLFRYQELVDKELEFMSRDKVGRAQQNTSRPTTKNPVAPIILDEIRKRMQEAVKRHPSYQAQHKDDSQIGLDEVSEEDEWPITGENPL